MRLLLLLTLFFVIPLSMAHAHCQIPCGIYDDKAELAAIEQHIDTIEKSMNEINRLQAETPSDVHKITRWTINKEEHAQKIQDSVAAYFLTQRVKVPSKANDENYVRHLKLLHQISVYAMKAKQTTDLENASLLRDLLGQYHAHYFKEHGHKH